MHYFIKDFHKEALTVKVPFSSASICHIRNRKYLFKKSLFISFSSSTVPQWFSMSLHNQWSTTHVRAFSVRLKSYCIHSHRCFVTSAVPRTWKVVTSHVMCSCGSIHCRPPHHPLPKLQSQMRHPPLHHSLPVLPSTKGPLSWFQLSPPAPNSRLCHTSTAHLGNKLTCFPLSCYQYSDLV